MLYTKIKRNDLDSNSRSLHSVVTVRPNLGTYTLHRSAILHWPFLFSLNGPSDASFSFYFRSYQVNKVAGDLIQTHDLLMMSILP